MPISKEKDLLSDIWDTNFKWSIINFHMLISNGRESLQSNATFLEQGRGLPFQTLVNDSKWSQNTFRIPISKRAKSYQSKSRWMTPNGLKNYRMTTNNGGQFWMWLQDNDSVYLRITYVMSTRKGYGFSTHLNGNDYDSDGHSYERNGLLKLFKLLLSSPRGQGEGTGSSDCWNVCHSKLESKT